MSHGETVDHKLRYVNWTSHRRKMAHRAKREPDDPYHDLPKKGKGRSHKR